MVAADDNFDVLLIWWIENESQCQNHMRKIPPSLGDGAVWLNFHARFGNFDYLKKRTFPKLVYRSEDREDLMEYWGVHKRTLLSLFPWLPDLDSGKVYGPGPDSSTLVTVESVSAHMISVPVVSAVRSPNKLSVRHTQGTDRSSTAHTQGGSEA
jgi:hypothetical protein